MSEKELIIKPSADAERLIEALKIVKEQVRQISIIMAQPKPTKDTQEKQDGEA